MKRLLAVLMMTTALTAPAQADPVSIGVAAAASAFSAAAAGTAAGAAAASATAIASGVAISGGMALSAGLASLSIASLATSAAIGGVLAGVTQALNGRPKTGSGAPNAALRQPSPVLPLVYGETRVGGFARVYAAGEASSADRRNLYSVWVLAAREIESILEIWDGENLMWSAGGGVAAPYADRLLMMGTRTGAAGQSLPAALVSGLPTTLDTAGAAETNEHLEGLPYVALRFSNVAKRWTRGTPSSMWFKVRGHKVHDPRDDSTEWSQNLALIAADYVRTVGGAAGAYLDDANISAAANLCDEAVALDPSGTQARYTFDGSIATDAEPRANLIGIMAHAAGQAVWTGAELLLQPGAYSAPVASFASADFVAPVRISAETLLEDHIDGVAGVFTSTANGFNATEYPQLTLDDYDPLDGAARLLPLDLPGIGDGDRAQRVALLSLRQTRRLKKFSFAVPLNATNAALEAGDRVSVSLPAIGLTAVGQIVTRRSVYDPASPRVEIEALEDGATFWTWAADTALAAPVSAGSNFPSPATVEPPVAPLTATPTTRLGADGAVVPTLRLTWGASDDPFLDDYEVTWVVGGLTRVARTTAPEYEIYGEAEGAALAIEIRAVNTLGVRSDPLASGSVAVVADTTPPPVPSVLTAAAGFKSVRFVFTPSSAGDWAGWVGYQVAVGASAPAISASAPRWATDEVTIDGLAPLVARRWWWRAVDRSGNQSAAVGPHDLTPQQIGADDIADAILDTAKFAAGIAPVALVASLPSPVGYDGPSVAFNTTDGKLYRLVSGAWTAAVLSVDISGEITEAQIADAAISVAKLLDGAVSAAKIADAAVSAAKIGAGAITETKLATGAVSAAKIAAGAVVAGKIAAGAITATEIAAGAVTAGKVAASAITATEIASGSVTAAKIAAGAVIAGKIAASAVSATELAANSVIAGKIAAGAVSATEIAANAIVAAKIAAGAVTATKISVADLSAISANLGTIAVGTANIGDLAVTTLKLAGVAVTEPKIAAAAVSDWIDTSSSTDIAGTVVSGVWETVVDISLTTPNLSFFKVTTRLKANVNNIGDLLWCRVLIGGVTIQLYSWQPTEDFDINVDVSDADWDFVPASTAGVRIQIRSDGSEANRYAILDYYSLEIASIKK